MGNHRIPFHLKNKDTGFHGRKGETHDLHNMQGLGVDCDFRLKDGRIRDPYRFHEHVQKDHTTDWFDLEDINMKARTILRHNAA